MIDQNVAGAEVSAASASRPIPALAKGPVLGLAAVVTVLFIAMSTRYDYHYDELYFLAAGKYYLDWGYMDQQPVVPLMAMTLDTLFPGSLLVFRLPAAIVTGLGVLLTALIAREFGGNGRAQVLAGLAYVLSPLMAINGHWLTASTMEVPLWLAIVWALIRWTRLHDNGVRRDRLLIWAGLAAALSIQVKFQVVILCAALLATIAIIGPRAMLRRPLSWVAVAIPLLTSIPTLWWQAAHGWPARDMGTAVANEVLRITIVPSVLFALGVVGVVGCCYGVYRLLCAPELTHYRYVGWTFLGVLGFVILTSGRANYVEGLFGVTFAAAAAGWQHRSMKPVWPVYLVSAALTALMLPIYPRDFYPPNFSTDAPTILKSVRVYESGWPELADTVARAYHALPPEQQRTTAVIADSYYAAGALDILGRQHGLPRIYSNHRGYWYFGAPPGNTETVLYVGSKPTLQPHFVHAKQVDTVKTGLPSMVNDIPVILYRTPTQPWPQLWNTIRTL